MSGSPSASELEAALRAAFEVVLPALVEETRKRLDGGHPKRAEVPAALDALPKLLDAAAAGGEAAVLTLLPMEHAELLAISKALDRVLAQRHRKLRNLPRMRADIAAEVVRRARRNAVFLSDAPSESAGE
ncbi:hypothetical protein L6R53_23265 [Myxococcota bacterium]|nr:hypothetical protein [Myxococcota bacterium]